MTTGQFFRPLDPIYDTEKKTGGLAVGNTPAFPFVITTINQDGGQADPTSTSPIVFDVAFSEPVTGFTTGDIDFSSSTAGGTLVGTVTNTGDDMNYTVDVTGMTTSGDVVVNVPTGVATSIATGMPNSASTSTDNTVSWVGPGIFVRDQIGPGTSTNPPWGLVQIGSVVYLTRRLSSNPYNAFLTSVDVSNPLALAQLDSEAVTPTTRDITWPMDIGGGYVMALGSASATSDGGWVVFDVSNPSAISAVASSTTQIGRFDGVVYGTRLYTTSEVSANGRCIITDISTPTSPTLVGQSVADTTANSQYEGFTEVEPGGAYVYASISELTGSFFIPKIAVYDVTTPSLPVLVTKVAASVPVTGNSFGGDLLIRGNILYASSYQGSGVGHITAWDISSPALPVELGYVSSTALFISRGHMDADAGGTEIFLASFTAGVGVAVVDISNPAAMAVTYTSGAIFGAFPGQCSLICDLPYLYVVTNNGFFSCEVV